MKKNRICDSYYFKIRKVSLFLILFIIAASAYCQNQIIKLPSTSASVNTIVQAIEKQTDLSVDYSPNILDPNTLINLDTNTPSLSALMKSMLDGKSLKYDIQGRHIIIKKAVSQRKEVNARDNNARRRVTGTIKDTTGELIIGASVLVKGTTNGTITDVDGHFLLDEVPNNASLVVSYVGYATQEVSLNGKRNLSIVLSEDSKLLDEVVVVGFGTQKKVNLTGAVSTVSSKEIAARPVNSVVDALQGTVAGMNFSAGSGGGALNSDKKFNIRGIGTIGSGSSVTPLVLIDGMEGDINTINPQDIENISILKDASASSIYGSRAAGGVVLVTTKSGKQGKVSINYNDNFRFNSPLNMPEMMDSYTWALYMNDACTNSGNGVWFSDSKLKQIKEAQTNPKAVTMFANNNNRWEVWDVSDLLPVGNTDWLKEHFTNSFSQEHNISINGGNDLMQYYVSANYLGLKGALRHGDDTKKRYTITSKVDGQLYKFLKLTYSMRFSRIDYDAPSWVGDQDQANLFYHNVCRYWPIIPVKDPNGYNVPESFVEELENGGRYKTQKDVLSQQLALLFTPIKNWNTHMEVNYRITNNDNNISRLTTYGHDVNGVPYMTNNNPSSVTGYGYKGNYFNPNIYTEYSRSFGDHNLKVMGGFQSEWYRYRDLTGTQKGVIANIPTLNTTSYDPTVSGGTQTWTTAGFFGRLNYDYKGRYLLEANIRYDGSSRFLRSNRWKTFPSFSIGWNIAQENFWKNLSSTVNTLKLRASWGQLGNQNTDSWYPFYSLMGYNTNAGTWLVNNAKPNLSSEPSLVSSSLTWEKNRTWEIGLDWGALKNRLTGSFGYYQRKTFDMVGPAPELPEILGTDVPKVNNLDMTSKGWDLQIRWQDYINDLYYAVSLVLSDNKIVIDKYPNSAKDLGQTYYKGAHLGDIWGYTTEGIAKTEEEMNNHLSKADQTSLGSNWTAGDIMYADLNGDGKVNKGDNTAEKPGDLRIIGNSTPRYNFGLNLESAWKGFDLKVFFQGTLKRDYWASGAVFWGACGIQKWQALGFTEHLDYFRADSNDPLGQNLDSYYPRVSWNSSRDTYKQTKYLQNAAYCRLKNITLGYTLPKDITSKMFIQSLRLFVSAENLLIITDFTKLSDPELIDAESWGFGKTYPLSKTISFGVGLTF